jgi:hypothetical protein
VGHRQAGLLRERDQLLDHVELALVAEVLRPVAGPVGVRLLALSVAAGEQSLAQRAPDQRPHPVALTDRQHLALDAPIDDRVRRLLGPEALEAAPLGDPLRLDDLRRREGRRTDRAHLAAVQTGRFATMPTPSSARMAAKSLSRCNIASMLVILEAGALRGRQPDVRR